MNTAVATTDLSRIDATTEAIGAWLSRRIASALALDLAQIDPDITFERYGLDSVQAVGVTADLGASLGLGELPPTLLYDYPTINQLTAHVAAIVRQ